MSNEIEIAVGAETWAVNLPAEKRVELRRSGRKPSTAGVGEQVRAALESPFEFESLRRALTPDDHVTLVVDETLPNVAEAVTAVLEHLGTAGVPPAAVTLLTPPGSRASGWIDELPDEFADVRTEVHDPADRNKLAYLATSKGERRIYLNRLLVEAEFVVVVSGRRYEPAAGYGGPESLLYPTFSDEETRAASADLLRIKDLEPDPEATEVAWLLGTPFFVQLIDDGDRVLDVVGGLPTSAAEGARRQDEFWRPTVGERPDAVIASIPSPHATFSDVALAAYHAARTVAADGKIVVLAPPVELSGDGVAILRQSDDPRAATKHLAWAKPSDRAACRLWASAARRGRLYVANVAEELAEELFASRVGNAGELQRLIDGSERVLVVPHADRTRVDVS